MKEVTNTKEIGEELTRIFNRFNHHFYNDELPEVIITFKPTKGAYGHITTAPVWISETSDSKYELNISAYTISRPPVEICETLLHEQAHLYNIIHGIVDCSNHGRYHNKKFKKTCEEHGLNCEKDSDGYSGWSQTSLDDDALKYFKRLNIKHFEYHYTKAPSGGNLMRYVCPHCKKTVAWVSSQQDLICGRCNEKLVYAPKKKSV